MREEGVLTPQLLEEMAKLVVNNYGKPDVIYISHINYLDLKEYNTWYESLKHLTPLKRKQAILKRRMLERKEQKHKIYNDYYW